VDPEEEKVEEEGEDDQTDHSVGKVSVEIGLYV
jgi:hypothetical protein